MDVRAKIDPGALPVRFGRYRLFDELGVGGMARVHLARQIGAAGFSRIVAIKRLHPHLLTEPAMRAMFVDEARLASLVVDPHVVRVLDVVEEEGIVAIVMEYIAGASLARALRAADAAPSVDVAVAIVLDVLRGLDAAHEARDAEGRPLGVVHRDVSPQNVLIGQDGLARVIDFGVAKAAGRLAVTASGEVKGKYGYMAPEQLRAEGVSRETDVFAVGVVAWELLTGERLYGEDLGERLRREGAPTRAPSELRSGLSRALDDVVLRAVQLRPRDRYPTARAFADALAAAQTPAPREVVARWLDDALGPSLEIAAERRAAIARRSEPTTNAPAPSSTSISRELTGASPRHAAGHVPPGRDARAEPVSPRGLAVLTALLAAVVAIFALRALYSSRRSDAASTPPAALDLRAEASSSQNGSAPALEVRDEAPLATEHDVPTKSGPVVAEPPAHLRAVRAHGQRAADRASGRPRIALPSCTPPFTIDDAGHKIYRPECF